MKLTILRVICVLLIVAAVGLYVYGIAVKGDGPTDNLLRTVVIALSGASALVKLTPKRHPLSAYASAYAYILGNAFENAPDQREKLLEAVRLFDEDKHPAALKVLDALRPAAASRDDRYAVGFFTALCQAGLGLNEAAIASYESLAAQGIATSLVYSNLAARHLALDQLDKAAEAGMKAVEMDPENASGHINVGNTLVRMGAYETAEKPALAACELKPDMREAWTLLAVVQSGLGKDTTEAFQQAVKAGAEPETLRRAMAYHAQQGQD